jgi:hypothetical protein
VSELIRSSHAFPVEHGIPIPPRWEFKRRYPFRKLHVRDSFFVPCEPQELKDRWNSLASSVRWATIQTGFKFAVRQVDGGLRVWRIQ